MPDRKPGPGSVIAPAAVLVVWLALCFAAVFSRLRGPGPVDLLPLALIAGIGGIGAFGLGRSVVRNFRRWGGGG